MANDALFIQVAEIGSLLHQAGRAEKRDIADVIPASQADALISMLRLIVERAGKRVAANRIDPY